MHSRVRRASSFIATLVVVSLLWNGFAHAATPPRRLLAFRAAVAAAAPAQVSQPTASPGTSAANPTPLGARDRLRLAHTLFLEQPVNDHGFPFSGTETYNAVLDALNRWGDFRMVSQADQADLVVQLHGIAIITSTPSADPATTPDSTSYDLQLKLTLADPHTLAPVWTTKAAVRPAVRRKTQGINIATAGNNVVSELKLLAGEPLTSQEQASLREAHKAHIVGPLLLVGAGVGVTLGIFFAARHHIQSTTKTFCQQNNLSPCPGS